MDASSSTAPPRAVMLRGPSLTSKTYFVPLPSTLDELIAKATTLFALPPGKVPHITLGSDERAIVLQESWDFIRDRELLHFRWTGDTAKRNLSNRVRWDEVAAAEITKAALQASPTQQVVSATKANTIANRDPNTQFGEGLAARKAHAQRVLAEQKRKEEEQHMADVLGSNPDTLEPEALNSDDLPLLLEQAPAMEPEQPASPEAPAPTPVVTPPIESPQRKKRPEHVDLDTPPSSGSRNTTSPFKAGERVVGPLRAEDDQSSSPIQSPTRDVTRQRGAEDVCAPLGAAVELKKVNQQLELIENAPVINEIEDPAPTLAESSAPDSTTAPVAPKNKDVDRVYSFLAGLVSQLLSHRANWAFQRPLSSEFEQFSARSSRPVDLFSIRDNLAARKYGSALLAGRVAANAVLTEFEDDLSLFYTNARKFFGVRSTQAECVEHLERFSKNFLNEWKRGHSFRANGVDTAAQRVFASPSSRVPGTGNLFKQSDFLFGPTGVKKPAAVPANAVQRPKPDFLYKRNASYDGVSGLSAPEAAAAPAGPKRAPLQPLTSEAFERALRAPSLTPQPDRIKARQEIVPPFITRSVIEPIPAQQQQAKPLPRETDTAPTTTETAQAETPTRKRKLDLEAENDTHSPSPPNSPSPMKRMVAAALPSLSSLKATAKAKKQSAKASKTPAAAPRQDQQSETTASPAPKRPKKAAAAAKASTAPAAPVEKAAPQKVKAGKPTKAVKTGKKTKSSTAPAPVEKAAKPVAPPAKKSKSVTASAPAGKVEKSRTSILIESRKLKTGKTPAAPRALRSNETSAKPTSEVIVIDDDCVEVPAPRSSMSSDEGQRRSSRPRKPVRAE